MTMQPASNGLNREEKLCLKHVHITLFTMLMNTGNVHTHTTKFSVFNFAMCFSSKTDWFKLQTKLNLKALDYQHPLKCLYM